MFIIFILFCKGRSAKGLLYFLRWKRDICNHFWYCCKVNDNYDDFFVSSYSLILSKVTVSQKLCVGLRNSVIHVFENEIFHYKTSLSILTSCHGLFCLSLCGLVFCTMSPVSTYGPLMLANMVPWPMTGKGNGFWRDLWLMTLCQMLSSMANGSNRSTSTCASGIVEIKSCSLWVRKETQSPRSCSQLRIPTVRQHRCDK